MYHEQLVPQEELLLEALAKLQEDEANLQQAVTEGPRKDAFLANKAKAEQEAEDRLRQALLMDDDSGDSVEEISAKAKEENDDDASGNSAFARLKRSLLTMEDEEKEDGLSSSSNDEDDLKDSTSLGFDL